MKKLLSLLILMLLAITLSGCASDPGVDEIEYPIIYVYDTCTIILGDDDYIQQIGDFSTDNYIKLYYNEDGSIILETDKLYMDVTNTDYECRRDK